MCPNLTPLGTSLAKHLSVIAPDHCVLTVIITVILTVIITLNFETLLTAPKTLSFYIFVWVFTKDLCIVQWECILSAMEKPFYTNKSTYNKRNISKKIQYKTKLT